MFQQLNCDLWNLVWMFQRQDLVFGTSCEFFQEFVMLQSQQLNIPQIPVNSSICIFGIVDQSE